MGLEKFNTSGGSDTDNSDSEEETKKVTIDPGREEERPHFTAVLDLDLQNVTTHKGNSAFPRSARYKRERIISIIHDKEQYEKLSELSEKHHGKPLEKLFKDERGLAKDFVDRLSSEDKNEQVSECPICEGEIDITEDDYTVISGKLVHGWHKVLKVVKLMELGEYGSR